MNRVHKSRGIDVYLWSVIKVLNDPYFYYPIKSNKIYCKPLFFSGKWRGRFLIYTNLDFLGCVESFSLKKKYTGNAKSFKSEYSSPTSYTILLTNGHPSCHVWFLMYWKIKILLRYPLSIEAIPLIRSRLYCRRSGL